MKDLPMQKNLQNPKPLINAGLVLLFLFAGLPRLIACDVCGCTQMGSLGGLLPVFPKNMIGVNFQYQRFKHPETDASLIGNSRVETDHFRVAEIWGRWLPHPRVQLWGTLPFHWHERAESQGSSNLTSIGDVRIMALYQLAATPDSSNRKSRHIWLIGATTWLPTGAYQQRDRHQLLFPMPFQAGTGSWQAQLQSSYIWQQGLFGFHGEGRIRGATRNELSYQTGWQTGFTAQGFARISTNRFSLVPSLSLHADYFATDLEFGQSRPETGGTIFSGSLGADLFFGPIYLAVQMRLPVIQNLPFTQPEAAWIGGIRAAWQF
jgi:hypothetical protein